MAAAIQVEAMIPASKHSQSATAELDLLRACCGPSGNAALTSALGENIFWDRAFQLARRHRLLPCLSSALRGRADVPGSIQLALDARFSSHTRRVLRFLAELIAIVREFEKLGIETILHKGPALAQRLYGDPATREFGDLDLLIRAKDVPLARAALVELGYGPQLALSPRQERAYLRTGYEFAFGSSLGPNVVELQWQILPRFYAVAFQPEEMFRRSVEFHFEGLRARILRDEDLLLALCVHAAKHCWSQLGMVRDIATLARKPLDWNWIVTEANRLGILRILTVSLVLGRNLLDLGLPRTLATGAGFKESEAMAAMVEDHLRCGMEPDTESLDYFRLMMRLREKRWHRAQFATRLAFTPSVGEWKAVRLPDAAFALYYGVRACRLLKRAFRS